MILREIQPTLEKIYVREIYLNDNVPTIGAEVTLYPHRKDKIVSMFFYLNTPYERVIGFTTHDKFYKIVASDKNDERNLNELIIDAILVMHDNPSLDVYEYVKAKIDL